MKLIISILLLIIGSYYLFNGGLNDDAIRSERALWNIGHIIYFILLSYFALKIINDKILKLENHYLKVNSFVILVSIGIGILIEVLQYGTGRSTDINDVANDVLGSFIVLAFYRPIIPSTLGFKIKIYQIIVIGMILISLTPLTKALTDESFAKKTFPVLADFTGYFETERWQGTADYIIVEEDGEKKLKVQFKPDKFSTIQLKYFESNWSVYNKLKIIAFNESKDDLNVTLKIYDRAHKPLFEFNDRFNQKIKIKTGLNTIEVFVKDIINSPAKRKMNIKEIKGLSLFTAGLIKKREIYVKSIELTQ